MSRRASIAWRLFVLLARDEKLTAFIELESVIRGLSQKICVTQNRHANARKKGSAGVVTGAVVKENRLRLWK